MYCIYFFDEYKEKESHIAIICADIRDVSGILVYLLTIEMLYSVFRSLVSRYEKWKRDGLFPLHAYKLV